MARTTRGITVGTDANMLTELNASSQDVPVTILTDVTGANNAAVSAGGLLSVDASGVAVPVTDNAGSLTVDNTTLAVVGGGLEATAMRVTLASDSTGLVSVDDNGGSLTIDNPALSVTGGGLEATALRVTIASDSTGVLSVDDNGMTISVDDGAGSLTVDGTVTAAAQPGVDIGDVTVNNAAGASAVNVQDGGNSLTIDGTVTANAGSGQFTIIGADVNDATASVNPVVVGFRAETPADSAPGNQVSAEGDVVRASADRDGVQYVHPHSPRIWQYTQRFTAAQTDAIARSATASLRHFITDIHFSTEAQMRLVLEESVTFRFGYTSAGGGDGVSRSFLSPIVIDTNQPLLVTTSGTSVTCDLVLTGYSAP